VLLLGEELASRILLDDILGIDKCYGPVKTGFEGLVEAPAWFPHTPEWILPSKATPSL
jgi:hypothetical protein